MRLTEYSDDTLCRSKHSIDFGPPRPNVGEGSGVRGRAHTWRSSQCFKIRIQSRVSKLIYPRGIPLIPSPSPALGRGEPMLAIVPVRIQLVEVSL